MKRFSMIAATAIAAVLAAAEVSSAVPVTISSTGTFGAGTSGASASGNQISMTSLAGTTTLQYNGGSDTAPGTGLVTIGSFSLPSFSGGLNSFTGSTLTLALTQNPPGSTKNTIGLVTATFFGQAGGALALLFAPATVSFDSVDSGTLYRTTYTNFQGTFATDASGGILTNALTATVTQTALGPVTPLPPAALAGVTLLGGVAGIRRMNAKKADVI